MKKLIFTIIISTFLLSCEEEPLQQGIETQVFGQIYDSVHGRSIENVKIRIAERIRQGTLAGTRFNFKGFVDSTITDANGRYDLSFETSGNGTIYDVELELREDVSFRSISEIIKEENIGGSEEINFKALKLYPVNLKITTKETFSSPILINTTFSGNEIHEHPAFGISSERIIWLDKNQGNEILFRMGEGDATRRSQKIVLATNSENVATVEMELSLLDFN